MAEAVKDAENKSKNRKTNKKVLGIAGAIILLVIIIGAAGSDGSQEGNDNKLQSNSQTTPIEQNTNNQPKTANQVKSQETATQPDEQPKSAETTKQTTKPKEASVPAEYNSALAQAETYSDTMHMSQKGIYDQLTSDYGGQFSAAAAQYAIDNVEADWNANALSQAKTYQDTMHLSPKAIHDQLTSQYGGKFTTSQADYAVKYLND